MQRNAIAIASLLCVGGLQTMTAEQLRDVQFEPDPSPAISSLSLLLSTSSEIPSTVPSSSPAAVQYDDMPSDMPSTVPSDVPSFQPSMVPSDMPSMIPSTFPSDMPSLLPTSSAEPSSSPSLTPTQVPSTPPSCQPSVPPTSLPSSVPSAMPSPVCHDLDSYKSPLNDFECKDHRGTDCTMWRYLGLTVDQVVELLKSCPESCNIDCVDLIPFEIALGFGIHQVPSFLGPSSVTVFETISLEYLNNYVPEQARASIFFLHKVELLSQHILERRRGLRSLSDRRRIQNVELVAKVRFTGYSLGLERSELEASLLSGISSSGLSRAIQRSGDQSFVDIEIVPALSPDASQRAHNPVSSGGRAGVAASSIASVLLVIGACLYIFYRYKRSTPQAPKAVRSTSSDSVGARSPRSLAQLLSFDSARHALSSPRESHDETATAEDSSNPSLKDKTSCEPNDDETDKEVDQDDDNSDEVEEEHPFTGVVPMMIVYDNIDEGTTTEGAKRKFKNVFPSCRKEASADLLASLRSGKAHLLDSSFESVINLDESGLSYCPNDVYFSPSSSQDDSIGNECDAGSVRSAPDTSVAHDETDNSELRKCTSYPEQSDAKELFAPLGRKCAIGSSEEVLLPRRSSPGTLNDPDRTPMGKDGRKRSDASGRVMQAIFGNPGKKIRKALNSSFEFSPSAARGAGPSPPRTSFGHLRSNSRSSDTSTMHQTTHGKQVGSKLSFHVPRHGNLGFVLECDADGGVTVRHVKDYSPLLGKVDPDDRILSIDGIDVTTQTSLLEVTNLLRGKSGSFWSQSHTMKIVVWRAQDDREKSNVSETSADSEDFLDFLATGANLSRPPLPHRLPVRLSHSLERLPVTSVETTTHEHKRNKSS